MLIDANLLLLARNAADPSHDRARDWLTEQLNGAVRVGLPWSSLLAFLRISTHPRAYQVPLEPDEAWDQIGDWLDAGPAWIPVPTDRHAEVLGGLIRRYRVSANLVPDAHLAALAIEHGLRVCSADTDFARFTEVTWFNPLAG
jgi:toxin-antitoxin system PIN domain toxin